MGEADLRQALDQRGQRLADAGKGLIEVRGNVGQLPLPGARRQAEGDPRLIDLLEGLLDRGFGRPLGLTALIEFLPRERAAGEERVWPG